MPWLVGALSVRYDGKKRLYLVYSGKEARKAAHTTEKKHGGPGSGRPEH